VTLSEWLFTISFFVVFAFLLTSPLWYYEHQRKGALRRNPGTETPFFDRETGLWFRR